MQIITFNLDSAQNGPQSSVWQITGNTFSDHLTSTLNFLIDQTPTPIFVAAAARQKAKPGQAPAKKDIYWIDLECTYKGQAGETVEGMPYAITFSDGKTRKGKIYGGIKRINDILAGQVTVTFGYPEAEKEFVQALKN